PPPASWSANAPIVARRINAPFPLVIVAAALIGALLPSPLWGGQGGGASAKSPDVGANPPSNSSPEGGGESLKHALLWVVLWLAPPALVALTLGTEHVLFQVALVFSILACVTFGGAYALLAYLTAEAVARGWLTSAQMIDGLGLAETTPGPLILVNEFVGFMAGWSAAGWGLALAGAAMALWCTFAPSFVWIFAGAPVAVRLENNRRAAGALAAIAAAVLGVIAKLALFFAAHALFERQLTQGPVELPDLASARLWMVALAAVATVALIRFKANLLALIAACALAGLAAAQIGL
ncbi:MAG: chromate transporter, partial [Alphaproteobacteria bacterium]